MAKKSASYNKTGIENLSDDKPVLYRIETKSGTLNYAGIAKRGRVQDRLKEHLDEIPGAKVKIEQFSSVTDARDKEARVIARNKPKYNTQGK